ncbi:MAG: DNA alkylation repair protein [Candidatus Pacearchaeota archaeon]|nr:DNA alkylation repair protein [Candidatus Pacearchaeota archaeon]
MLDANDLKKELERCANPEKAKQLSRYFKTGKGEYGEGDIFLGLTSAGQREVAKKYLDLCFDDIQKLLNSKIHEERQIALIVLRKTFEKSKNNSEKKRIFDFYLKNSKNINNWDLVDLSAPNIIGTYLLDKDRAILYKLAKSHDLWERRIAVLATFMFIKNNEFKDSLRIAEILSNDKHDLMHKAVGWMLREIGKRDQDKEEEFLKKHYKKMPRTMLRYAIERFDEKKRRRYLEGKI